MKKKVVTALLIIVLGGALIAAGYMMGGRVKKIFPGYNNRGWTMEEDWDSTTLADTRDIQLISGISAIKHFKAEVSYGALKVIPHDSDYFSYSITDNTEKIGASVQVQGDTLSVKTKKYRARFFGPHNIMGNVKTVIVVNIPKNTIFDTVDINIEAASLFLDGFTAHKSFLLKTGVGETKIKNITASDVNIKTGVGETSFRNCTFTDTVLETGIGETAFEGKIFKMFDIKAGIGETDLRINGKKEDYSFDITSGIGSVHVDGSATGSGLGSSISVDRADAPHTIHVKAGIGEVNINFTE